MRRLGIWSAAGLCLAVLAAPARAERSAGKDKEAATCGSFGTSVEFAESPEAAAAQAKKEEKLVFVLHVSGNFEDPRFT
jgi:hypothetical protein